MARESVARADAMRGNDAAESFHDVADLETGGKSVAFDCLGLVIDASGVPRKVLAEECAMSEGYFSKVVSGQQGDVVALLYKLRAEIRREFYRRMAEHEQADPVEIAAEQLTAAALRFLRLRSGRARMAKASL